MKKTAQKIRIDFLREVVKSGSLLTKKFISMLAGSGGAPRAAIFMGRRDNDTAERIMGNCFSLLMIFSVTLTVIFSISLYSICDLYHVFYNVLDAPDGDASRLCRNFQ